MRREQILLRACNCVTGDREEDYGSPESNFAAIANFWNTYIDRKGTWLLDGKDVAAMLALLKIARIASGHAKTDNWIDLAGYAACGGELQLEEVESAGTACSSAEDAANE